MGTNYYAVRNRPTTEDPIHIGKSSYGWMFLFCRHNDQWHDPPIVWSTYKQVKEWLKKYTVDKKDYVIIDEYDEVHTLEEFTKMVDEKQKDPNVKKNPDNFRYSDNVDGYRFTDGPFW